MALKLNISSESSDLKEMSVYGMDKKSHDSFVSAINDGDISLYDYSWADEDTEWPEGVSAEILAQAQFFSDPAASDSFEVTVCDEDEDPVAEGVTISHIYVKTNKLEPHKRYAVVWANCENGSYYADLPDEVEKENLDPDAFYAFRPNIDSRLAHEDLLGDEFFYSIYPLNIYYIPNDELKKLLKENAEELGIERDLDDDFYFDPDEDFSNISWERAAELLEEFRLEVELNGYDGASSVEALTLDEKLKELESIEE